MFSELYDPNKRYTFEEIHGIWDKLWESIVTENRAFMYSNGYPGFFPVAFATMHGVVGDYIFEKYSKKKRWNDESNQIRDVITSYVEQVLDIIKSNERNSTIEESRKEVRIFFHSSRLRYIFHRSEGGLSVQIDDRVIFKYFDEWITDRDTEKLIDKVYFNYHT